MVKIKRNWEFDPTDGPKSIIDYQFEYFRVNILELLRLRVRRNDLVPAIIIGLAQKQIEKLKREQLYWIPNIPIFFTEIGVGINRDTVDS